MIVRIVRALVKPGHAVAFNQLVREQLSELKQHDGLVYVKLARSMEPEGERVILVEEWKDANALHGWAGADLAVARMAPGAEEHLLGLTVEHYEAIDIDPDMLW